MMTYLHLYDICTACKVLGEQEHGVIVRNRDVSIVGIGGCVLIRIHSIVLPAACCQHPPFDGTIVPCPVVDVVVAVIVGVAVDIVDCSIVHKLAKR